MIKGLDKLLIDLIPAIMAKEESTQVHLIEF